jgi:predicted secreted acid phosphatase
VQPLSRRPTQALALLLALAGLACAGAPRGPRAAAAAPPADDSLAPLPLFEAIRQVESYLDSGRYEADVARVVAEAEAYLEQRAGAVTKPAIVLDIDETSLSNWPAYRLNGWGRVLHGGCDLERGPCGVRAWQALARSEALLPTLALVRRARALGVAVFFVSGRPAELRDATERNLRERGFEWDGLAILPEGARFASAVAFKVPERRKIAERGYTILLNLGDQASDLDGGFAERTFKLPNPVYFLP